MAAIFLLIGVTSSPTQVLHAGAFAADISPEDYPVIVNAMFTERTATRTVDPLFARCVVLDDGAMRLAIVVVDTCMLPRDLIDEAKRLAQPFPSDRILISATHTHSAPSAMGCLGSRVDAPYARSLPAKIAASISMAAKRLEPARIGWKVVQDYDHTYNRRWMRRPDRIDVDPFGERTVRANMHPGHESPDVVGPSGPVDPDLSIVSIQSLDGRPLALLANYSMHYYGSPLLSSDYFGKFSAKVAKLFNASNTFVAAMSQGTSGDLMWMDYGKPRRDAGYDAYADAIAQRVYQACSSIQYRERVSLTMAEVRLPLRYRVPDAARLEWARKIAGTLGGRLPKTQPEIYALEAIHLHERQSTELVLQALRIGELGITAIPNEVFALTGLKLKAQSPLQPTFNIELANGAEGYIPPPEQHKLGGYTTWPARTAGLEVEAEPKIVEELLRLLERVSGRPRRLIEPRIDSRMMATKPLVHWPMDDFGKPASGQFEDGVAFYLDGVVHRAVHFAGGRLRAKVSLPSDRYSGVMWFWNGMPDDAGAIGGKLWKRGTETLNLGGTAGSPGRLIYNGTFVGRRTIPLRTWCHLAVVRAKEIVTVYLDGEDEIVAKADAVEANEVLIGELEGRVDEVALYDRSLTPAEIKQLAAKP